MPERPDNDAAAAGAGRADLYLLEDGMPSAPSLPGEVVAVPSTDELIDRLAADLVIHAENCVRSFGDFHLALSGGPELERLYARLMYDPNYRRLPWRRTQLWLASEQRPSAGMRPAVIDQIDQTISDHADIPRNQVHPIPVESSTAADEYERQLKESLAWREKGHDRLDFVLLVMDGDGSIAGLLPHTAPLAERSRLVRPNGPSHAPAPDRVTMTLPLINAARFVAVMAVGRRVEPAVRRLAAGRAVVDELPARGLAPLNGELRWYLDADACDRGPGSSGPYED
jgi:6-phosphogluconolactonase/glucosamine-6-phosphate isomerase/deaminase